MAQQREKWLDIAKAFACVLIVAGHLLVGLDYAGIVAPDGIHGYFVRAMYFFHVQTFFFCSGFLYQKRGKKGLAAHGKNILKKLVELGIPYAAFTTVSFFLKKIFEGSVNNPTNRTLFQMIFTDPDAPYWYLYALFFMFVITPKFSKKKTCTFFLALSVVANIVYELFLTTARLPHAVEWIMEFWVWFVLGMFAAKIEITEKRISLGKCIPYLLFIPVSFAVYRFNVRVVGIELIMGVLGIAMTVSFAILAARKCFKGKNTAFLTKYTMPVFLMHTMASPAARAVLLKCKVTSVPVHIAVGMAVGIVLPILAAYVMEKTVVLEFFMYPLKTVKKLKQKMR